MKNNKGFGLAEFIVIFGSITIISFLIFTNINVADELEKRKKENAKQIKQFCQDKYPRVETKLCTENYREFYKKHVERTLNRENCKCD